MTVRTKTKGLLLYAAVLPYCYLVENYPKIISIPHDLYYKNALSPNRSTGICAPEFTVCAVLHKLYWVMKHPCHNEINGSLIQYACSVSLHLGLLTLMAMG